MKLSDLKKLPVGTKLRCVTNFQGPCDLPREIVKMQTNGMHLRGPVSSGGEDITGWCEFPKADGFRDDGDGFTLTKKGLEVSYKFVSSRLTDTQMESFIQRCRDAGITTREEAARVLGFTVDRPESHSLATYARMHSQWTAVLDAVMAALFPNETSAALAKATQDEEIAVWAAERARLGGSMERTADAEAAARRASMHRRNLEPVSKKPAPAEAP